MKQNVNSRSIIPFRIFGLFLVLLSGSCSQDQESPKSLEKVVDSGRYEPIDPVSWMKADTVLLAGIDQYVMAVRQMEDEGKYFSRRIALSAAFSDSMDYFLDAGQLIKIQSLNKGPAQELWLEYYLQDGNLVFMRHREWNHRPEASSAREIYFYFRDNELFFALERYLPLQAFQPPIELLDVPLKMSDRPKENLMFFVNRLWPSAKALIEEDRKANG